MIGTSSTDADGSPPAKLQTAPPRVLLADHDADRLKDVFELLARRYAVKGVVNVEAALKSIKEQLPDIVLTDVTMPSWNGLSLLGHLRARPLTKMLPVILFSNRGGVGQEELEEGADDFLPKPILARELFTRVRTHLELSRLRREARLQMGSAHDGVEDLVQKRTVELARRNKVLREQEEHLRRGNTELIQRLSDLQAVTSSVRDSRRAALNLLEDAAESRRALQLENSERQRSEEALRVSEERLRAMFEQAAVGIVQTSPEGKLLVANPGFCQLLGYSAEEISSLTAEKITHPKDLKREKALSARMLVGDIPGYSLEKRCVRRDESLVWVNTSSSLVRKPGGEPDYTLTIVEDITERREAEAAQRASEARFRAVGDLIPDLLWRTDAAGAITWNNQRWYDYTGQTPDEVTDSWGEVVHPNDRKASHERFRTAVETGFDYEHEHRLRRADGEYRWFLVRARPVRGEGGLILHWFGSCTDIDDIKRTEAAFAAAQERLRLIVDSAHEHAIISMDLERRVTSWNPGAERMTGYTTAEVFNQPADIIFTPEDVAAGAPSHEAGTALTVGRASDERWHLRKDGSRFWGSGVMLPMRGVSGGEVIGLVKIFRDETEKRDAREALEKSRENLWAALQETERARAEAEAAGLAKDHFLAVLSHELRTPLTPVFLATQTLVRRKDLPPPVRNALAIIHRNIQTEAHLIDDLLDVTRIARGKMELVRAPMDVHQAIRHAVEVSRPDIEGKKQKLSLALEAAEHRLDGDATRLEQVVWNLLKNASKFTPEAGWISVRTWNAPGFFLLEISDSGIGIEAEEFLHIFDAFAQANATITRQFGGLGLGLAISKASVEAHGGEMRAKSAGRGKGATFIVSLPLLADGKS